MVGRSKSTTKVLSKSQRAGITFPAGRIRRYLKRNCLKFRIATGSPIYLAAVLEYLTAEVLELAGNAARDNRKNRLTPRHILLAVANDDELNKLLKNVTIACGGVLPQIQPELIKKKNSATESSPRPGTSTSKSPKTNKVAGKSDKKPKPDNKKTNYVTSHPKGNKTIQIISEKKLFLGQKMTVIQGDIASVTVDGIIHPTNSTFSHSGMIGQLLETLGGSTFTDDLTELKQKGSLQEAEVSVSVGRNIPAKFVLHVNNPPWSASKDCTKLQESVKNCLVAADNKGLKSLAIPCIGSGRGGYPKKEAAQSVMKSISQYFVGVMTTSLKQIYFVLHDSETLDIYKGELESLKV